MLRYICREYSAFFFLVMHIIVAFVIIDGMLKDCKGACFPSSIHLTPHVKFVSTHIWQCKYSYNNNAWPWILLFGTIALSYMWHCSTVLLVILYAEEGKIEDQQNFSAQSNSIALQQKKNERRCPGLLTFSYLAFLLTCAGWLTLVFFDNHWFAASTTCIKRSTFDPSTLHAVGVMLLTIGIFLHYTITFYVYIVLIDPTPGGKIRRFVLAVQVFVYVAVLCIFAACYVLENYIESIWAEYVLIWSVLFASICNLWLYVHIAYRLQCTQAPSISSPSSPSARNSAKFPNGNVVTGNYMLLLSR